MSKKPREERCLPDDWQEWAATLVRLAGVDEAGRGPLAGPVIAAAVVLPADFDCSGITDSKRLTAAARERLYQRLQGDGVGIGIGIVEADEIDRLNILRATHEAMRRAIAALPEEPDGVCVDGLPVPRLHSNCRHLIQGDQLHLSIGAASIIAKVTRDRLMSGSYHEQYPLYNFAAHKGYGTAEHLQALWEHGPCPLHRRSFAPVAQTVLRFESLAPVTQIQNYKI